MYDLARSTVALTGLLGATVVVALAIRRQRSIEQTVRITASAQLITAEAYALDVKRNSHEQVRDLRDRFTTAAAQLGDDAPAVRLAGVYAMAALADDWLQRNQADEAQGCIDVLCAYIRTPRHTNTDEDTRADLEVRQTIIRTISNRLQPRGQAGRDWRGRDFDFTGAIFNGLYTFRGAHFAGGTVTFNGARFTGSWVTFDRAQFTGSWVSFRGAQFTGAGVTFDGSQFAGGTVDFTGAQFAGGATTFEGAQFIGGRMAFMFAQFTGGTIAFDHARFASGRVTLAYAQLAGGTLTFDRAEFAGGKVAFDRARPTRGNVPWRDPRFAGTVITFRDAHFRSTLPRGPWEGQPPPVWPPHAPG